MKVRDLVAALLNYNQDLPVVVANFEFGFDDLVQIQIIETVTADHGDSTFVLADGQPPSEKQTVLCLGPLEPSVLLTRERSSLIARVTQGDFDFHRLICGRCGVIHLVRYLCNPAFYQRLACEYES